MVELIGVSFFTPSSSRNFSVCERVEVVSVCVVLGSLRYSSVLTILHVILRLVSCHIVTEVVVTFSTTFM